MGLPRLRLGIPAQLLLVSSVLAAPPLAGPRSSCASCERLVLDAQEQALAATARRAAAAPSSDRPSLLLRRGRRRGRRRALRLLDLPRPIVVDGRADDWDDPAVEAHRLPEPDDEAAEPPPLSAVYRIGRQGNGVYALFEVRDREVVLRDPERPDGRRRPPRDRGGDGRRRVPPLRRRRGGRRAGLGVARSRRRQPRPGQPDRRRLADRRGRLDRRAAAAAHAGRTAARLRGRRRRRPAGAHDRRRASRRAAPPRARRSPPSSRPRPRSATLLAGLGGPRTRLWVDRHRQARPRPRAARSTGAPALPGARRAAGLARCRGLSRADPAPSSGRPRRRGRDRRHPAAHEVDARALRRAGHAPARGRPARASSSSPPRTRSGSGAACGGAVLVEEADDRHPRRPRPRLRPLPGRHPGRVPARGRGAPRLRHRASPSGSAGCATASSGSTDGPREPPAVVPDAGAGDEIGDLARSVAALAERQREHAAYLEQVGRRLSHEMRTPVGVVRTSLDNLRLAGAARRTPACTSTAPTRACAGSPSSSRG